MAGGGKENAPRGAARIAVAALQRFAAATSGTLASERCAFAAGTFAKQKSPVRLTHFSNFCYPEHLAGSSVVGVVFMETACQSKIRWPWHFHVCPTISVSRLLADAFARSTAHQHLRFCGMPLHFGSVGLPNERPCASAMVYTIPGTGQFQKFGQHDRLLPLPSGAIPL